jgi:hypothetical protein
MANDKDHDGVGYGRPPRRTRFKKGRSGNPRGRPKGSKNLATQLTKTLGERVVITQNGRRRSITKLDAAAKQLANSAAAGDLKAIHQLMMLAQWVAGRTEALAPSTDPFTDADREVIAAICARLSHRTEGGDNG